MLHNKLHSPTSVGMPAPRAGMPGRAGVARSCSPVIWLWRGLASAQHVVGHSVRQVLLLRLTPARSAPGRSDRWPAAKCWAKFKHVGRGQIAVHACGYNTNADTSIYVIEHHAARCSTQAQKSSATKETHASGRQHLQNPEKHSLVMSQLQPCAITMEAEPHLYAPMPCMTSLAWLIPSAFAVDSANPRGSVTETVLETGRLCMA